MRASWRPQTPHSAAIIDSLQIVLLYGVDLAGVLPLFNENGFISTPTPVLSLDPRSISVDLFTENRGKGRSKAGTVWVDLVSEVSPVLQRSHSCHRLREVIDVCIGVSYSIH